jgi:hypothetical protein
MTTPAPLTPLPGMTGMVKSPIPGTLAGGNYGTPSPTTLGAAAGQVQAAKSKTPFIVAGALVAIGAAVAVFMIMSKNKGAQNAAKPDDGSGAVVTMDNKGSAEVGTPPNPNTGSAAVTPPNPNTGSAAGTNTGSAAVKTPETSSGSAAVKTPDLPNTGSATNIEKTVVKQTVVTINSDPPGADIYVNSTLIPNKKTPADLNLDRTSVKITLRLRGYDKVEKTVSVGDSAMKLDLSLKKSASPTTTTTNTTTGTTGTGKGSGTSTTGTGKTGTGKTGTGKTGTGKKGTGTKCDTCLERPD